MCSGSFFAAQCNFARFLSTTRVYLTEYLTEIRWGNAQNTAKIVCDKELREEFSVSPSLGISVPDKCHSNSCLTQFLPKTRYDCCVSGDLSQEKYLVKQLSINFLCYGN